jgi:hypothetical protein
MKPGAGHARNEGQFSCPTSTTSASFASEVQWSVYASLARRSLLPVNGKNRGKSAANCGSAPDENTLRHRPRLAVSPGFERWKRRQRAGAARWRQSYPRSTAAAAVRHYRPTKRIAPSPTHTEIASRVSTHREAVTRELTRLSRIGLIERQRNALLVKDVERLAEMVHATTSE